MDKPKQDERTKGNMIELIPSKDVRECIKKTERTFTDFEKAAIIYNLCLPFEKMTQELMELGNTTRDEKLKKQLNERMQYDEKCLELYAHKKKGYVYIVFKPGYDDIFRPCGCFTESDPAYFHGKKLKQPFMIEKYRLNHADSVAALHFDASGELLYCYSREKDRKNREVRLSDEKGGSERFEHAYVDIPNPFDAGDRVRCIQEGKCGVVVTSQEEWKRENECRKKQAADFGDIGITVYFREDDGRTYGDSINPLFLERYVPAEAE